MGRRAWVACVLLSLGACTSRLPAPLDPPPDDEADAALPVPSLDPAACPAANASGAPAGFDRKVVPQASASKQEDRAYPVLALLQSRASLTSVRSEPAIVALDQARDAKLGSANACAGDRACVGAALAFGKDDAHGAAAALAAALAARSDLAPFAKDLRASGGAARFAALEDSAFAAAALEDTLLALDATFASVAPELDAAALAGVVSKVRAAHPAGTLAFFEPALFVSVAALEASHRDEATRYEPYEKENGPALARLATLDFAPYPFTVIVVPGLGPGVPGVALSDGGRARCEMAAARFHAKIAPYILTSGGHVHPDRTPFAEAVEMKKALVESFGVPADAVLIDPYARHTTTNLRNAGRILLRIGLPRDRPALVTTDLFQSADILGQQFVDRCTRELGYQPWSALGALSSYDTCLRTTELVLQADGRDPLDP